MTTGSTVSISLGSGIIYAFLGHQVDIQKLCWYVTLFYEMKSYCSDFEEIFLKSKSNETQVNNLSLSF